jgi:hypothetical protein
LQRYKVLNHGLAQKTDFFGAEHIEFYGLIIGKYCIVLACLFKECNVGTLKDGFERVNDVVAA